MTVCTYVCIFTMYEEPKMMIDNIIYSLVNEK